jgi:hypothetical protein
MIFFQKHHDCVGFTYFHVESKFYARHASPSTEEKKMRTQKDANIKTKILRKQKRADYIIIIHHQNPHELPTSAQKKYCSTSKSKSTLFMGCNLRHFTIERNQEIVTRDRIGVICRFSAAK